MKKGKATGQGNIEKLFQVLNILGPANRASPSEAEWKTAETKEKANIFNQQFQSVSTPLDPLSLQESSLMKVKSK